EMVRTPVGDRYVVERMRRDGFRFGGEQSGHLIFLDHATTGDGIVAALQLLSIVVEEQRPLSELANGVMQRVPQVLVSERFALRNGVMRRVPQVLVRWRVGRREPLEAMPRMSWAVDQLEETLGENGRVVVRWSGTEPKLRVMIEGDDEARITAYARDLVEAAR